MEQAIIEIENMCQEKLLVFHELLTIIRKEKKSIIKADVGALWKSTREKQEKADKITDIRSRIIDTLDTMSFAHDLDLDNFSLNTIISILPKQARENLINIKNALVGVKTQISAISHENRLYLEESLSTIEDLVNIITGNCVKDEVYNREQYLGGYARPAHGIKAYKGG